MGNLSSKMTHGSLFTGILGFDIAAEWAGLENIFQCEVDNFCNKLIKKRYPKTIHYGDITKTDFSIHRGSIDIITGGFPCQNISRAASRNRTGIKGEKSGLWIEMLRACKEIQPSYIIIENSPDLRRSGLNVILDAFAKIGYDAEWQCLQGNQFGTPQRRKRLFLILYTTSIGDRLAEKQIFTGWDKPVYPAWRDSDPRIYGVVDGIPNRVDRHRALGNAVIALIPYEIIKAIVSFNNTINNG